MLKVNCPHCGSDYETKNYYKLDNKGLDRKYTVWKTKCKSCGKWLEIEDGPKYGLAAYNQCPDKATKRVLGTPYKLPGRARWAIVPSDLKEKLEEEQRLREEREAQQKEQDGEVESSEGEGVDSP